MDWRSRSTRKLLGKIVTVQVDRPIGYLHGDILYPVNYGFVPGLMGGDGEEQDAYILGVDTPLSSFTGRVIAVIRRHNDCEDKLVEAVKVWVSAMVMPSSPHFATKALYRPTE